MAAPTPASTAPDTPELCDWCRTTPPTHAVHPARPYGLACTPCAKKALTDHDGVAGGIAATPLDEYTGPPWQVGDVVATGTPGDTRIWIRVRPGDAAAAAVDEASHWYGHAPSDAPPDPNGDPTWVEVHADAGRDGFHVDGVYDDDLPPDPVLLVRAGRPANTPTT